MEEENHYPPEVPATEAQLNLLVQLGVPLAELITLDKYQAQALIADLRSRPTQKQIALLVRNGWTPENARKLTIDGAKLVIEQIAKKQGWKK